MKRLNDGWGAIIILVLCGSRVVPGEAERELRELLLNNHRASVEAIRTIKCKVQIESATGTADPAHHVSGEYWYSGTDLRIKEIYSDGHTEDIAVRDGRYLSLGRSKTASAASKGNAQDFTSICDVRDQMILYFRGKKTSHIALDDLLRWSGPRHALKRVKEHGNTFIVVTATVEESETPERTLEIWFDASVNFLVRKMTVAWGEPEAKSKAMFEIISFAELQPGVFFPTECRTQAFRPNGEPLGSMVCKLSEVRVNSKISSDVFELRIPAGTSMADRTLGKIYEVDARGNPTGAVQALATKAPGAVQSVHSAQVTGRQTQEDGWDFWQWLASGCLIVAASFAVAMIVRRRRASSDK